MTNKLQHHQSVYATPGLPPFEFSRVSHRILAGRNPLTAVDVETLLAQGVTHFLDLRESREWQPPRHGYEAVAEIERRGLTRLHLPVVDSGVPTATDLDRAIWFLDEALANPQAQVYIHCRAGIERTSAVLTAYHARRLRMTYDEALAQLRRQRPTLRPHGDAVVRRWLNRSA